MGSLRVNNNNNNNNNKVKHYACASHLKLEFASLNHYIIAASAPFKYVQVGILKLSLYRD
jgi:hypothetical protein